MTRMIGRRLVQSIPVVLVVSFLVFGMVSLVPGDAAVAIAGDNASPEVVAELRQQLGLDQPFFQRYWDWLSHALRGDFGSSITSGRSVTSLITARLPVTLSLTLGAMVVAIIVGTFVGIVAGMRPNGAMDKIANVGSSVGVAAPNYFIGTILVIVFAMRLDIFPPTGYVGVTDNPAQWFWHLVLPAIALGLAPAAVVARQLRQGVILERSSNYARTAKSKGLAPSQVVSRHVLRNGSQPAITALGLQLVLLLGGTVIIESLFGMPGVGLLVLDAVRERDFPVLQGVAMMSTIVVILVNIGVDVIYAGLNPRLRR